jgi:protein involved in polysaccharide export with SLBB domain
MSIRNVGKQLTRWGMVLGLSLAGLGLAGCGTGEHFAALPPGLAASSGAGAATAPAPAPASVAAKATNPAAGGVMAGTKEPHEVFRVGDSLTIVYTDLPVSTPAFQGKIKEDGTVTLLLNQKFIAAGKTTGELEEEIRAFYVPKYFKYLTATVNAVESTRWYYIYGEVRSPNRQLYTSRLTVLQAITSAGGFTDFAKKTKVKLTRVDGRSQIINCTKAQTDPKFDPEVYPGDTIHVPRRLW